MKKFIEYFLASGIAFMVFATMLIAENTQFQALSRVQNPFESAEKLDQIVEIENNQGAKEIFTPSAEMFILEPGSRIDFSEKKRAIMHGKVFASFYLINDEDYRRAENALRGSEIFKIQDFSPAVGQIQIGPILVKAPGSTLFIVRDEDAQRSQLYVFGHSVELFFDGIQHPFIIPSGMSVDIRENLITEKTASLFHSKLKKEFRMKPFSLSLTPSLENITDEEKMAQGLRVTKIWEDKIRNFALNAPESWRIQHKDSWGTNMLQNVTQFQDKFAWGLSQKTKDKRKFEELLRPFVKAHFFIKDRKKLLAERAIQEFEKSLDSFIWKDILNRDEEIRSQWDIFLRAHTAWIRTVFPGDMEEVFSDFWLDYFSKDSFKKIEKSFSNAELLFSNHSYRKANEEFVKLRELLDTFDIEEINRFEITKIRRLLVEIIRNEPFFQTEDMFDFYRLLITKEILLHEADPDFQDEIKLESAQDILSFLNNFLEDRSKINISRILLKGYESLHIDEVVIRLGREVFTPEENELIEFIALIGNAGMTQEELDAIKNAKTYQDELDARIQELQNQRKQNIPNETTGEDTLHTVAGIQNAKQLKSFLEESGIQTSSMIFKTIREEKRTEFSSGRWKGLAVSGDFQYSTQFFGTFQVGLIKNENLHSRFLVGFLKQIEKDKETVETPENQEIFVSQTTPRSILERKLVQESLELEGFIVSLDDIKIIDPEMKIMSVQKAAINKKYNVTFMFLRESQILSEVTVTLGKSKIDFRSETFPVQGAASILISKIENLNRDEEQN